MEQFAGAYRRRASRCKTVCGYYTMFPTVVHPSAIHFSLILAVEKNLACLTLAFFSVPGYNIDEEKEGMVPNMSEEFGPDFISVTDEDGNEFELEHLDTLEYNGQTYMAFFPAVPGEEDSGEEVKDVDLDEEYGLIILKVVQVDGEEQLSTLDSDEELELVYQQFMESLFAEDEGEN